MYQIAIYKTDTYLNKIIDIFTDKNSHKGGRQ